MMYLALLSYLGALVEARVQGPWPDLILVFMLPLTLRGNSTATYPILLLLGVLRDGMNPSSPWVSPLFFLLAGFVGNFLRDNVNLNLVLPRVAYVFLFTLLYEGFIFSVNGAPITHLLYKVVLTGVIAVPITYLRVR